MSVIIRNLIGNTQLIRFQSILDPDQLIVKLAQMILIRQMKNKIVFCSVYVDVEIYCKHRPQRVNTRLGSD